MTKKSQAAGPVAAEVPPAPSAECPHPLPSSGGSYILTADGRLIPEGAQPEDIPEAEVPAEPTPDVKEA
jgi:hypothetical protein